MGWLRASPTSAKRPQWSGTFLDMPGRRRLRAVPAGVRGPKRSVYKLFNLRLGLPHLKSLKITRRPQLEGESGYIFRRSRTLTGTTSPHLTTATTAAQLKTPRLKTHELKKVRSRVLKLLSLLVLCIALLGYGILSYIANFTVTYAQPVGLNGSRTGEYTRALSRYFGNRPLERFSFVLNSTQLESYMLGQYPELSGFAIVKQWHGGDVRFVAKMRTPILVWETGQKRYYVDGEGSAFTYYQGSNAKLVSVADQSGVTPSEVDNTIASKRFISFLGKMVNAVNGGGRGQVSGVMIPSSTREIDLKLQGRGYPIKTNIDRDPLQQAEDVIAALKYFDAHKITPEYVDVRVGSKAFYK